MFNTLIETNGDDRETGRRAGYLSVTAAAYAMLIFSVFVWSLYSINLNPGDEDLVLSTLTAPASMPDTAPPPVEIERPKSQPKATDKSEQNVDVRPQLIQNAAEAPLTNKDRTVEGVPPRRIGMPTIAGDKPSNADGGIQSPTGNINHSATGSTDHGARSQPPPVEVESAPELPKTKPVASPSPKPKTELTTVSKGVINGIAKSLPKPAYPAAARLVHVSGEVKVQVTIDEQGNVVSAAVVSGHQLLRAAAQTAARQAKFTPTKLSDQPVKVTGIIVYNFVAP